MTLPKLTLSPVVRVTIGLIALLIGWLLLLDLLVGISPNQNQFELDSRKRISENLAINSSILIQTQDYRNLKKLLEQATVRDELILSAAVRLKNKAVVTQTADHEKYWNPTEALSTMDFVHVGLNVNGKPWGNLEIAFKPSGSTAGLMGWLKNPSIISLLLVALGSLVLYFLYLKKIFSYLDPSSVIPDRVRVAFDSFSEGVMMIDRAGRVVLANKILRSWVDEKDTKIFGQSIKHLTWLSSTLEKNSENHPWMQAMASQEPILGFPLDIKKSSGDLIKSIINCSPIQDSGGSVRGCLITFDDVTKMHQLNNELKTTNEELQKSRLDLDRQNDELRKLATRDPMTNCLNRRAFFESAEKIFNNTKNNQASLCIIMADIDFFKRFNDNFGHAVGDKVIISVAKIMFSGLRMEDLFCRYGGEEFCILLPGANLEVAMRLAERLRIEIESHAGSSLRSEEALKITSSFGVSTATTKTTSLLELIDQADKALYRSKENGRNQVSSYDALAKII
jgi:diguanylate cyclase (GGDEF)-like protein/PAS domain S-box-containing protein